MRDYEINQLIERVALGENAIDVFESSVCEKKLDPNFLSIEVIDKSQDKKKGGKVIKSVRASDKYEKQFKQLVAKYKKDPHYVVQVLDNKTDSVVMDNQGSGGKIRKLY